MPNKKHKLIKKQNNIKYYQSSQDKSLKAIYENVLVGSADINSQVSFFEIDVKEGLDPLYYGLTKYCARTKKLNGNEIRGGEVLRNLVEEMQQETKFLAACWKYGDNLKQFNKNLEQGLTLEDSVRNTFTSKIYKEFGFDKFIIYNLQKNGKGYEVVETLFYKNPKDLELINLKKELKNLTA